jgi:transcriptional regulator with XRE-family HTH domain
LLILNFSFFFYFYARNELRVLIFYTICSRPGALGAKVNRDVLAEIMRGMLKNQNRSLSLRGFARQLGLNSSALSEFLSGKRNFSESKVREIIKKLSNDPLTRAEIYSRVFLNPEQEKAWKLEEEVFAFISDPIYFTFLQLLEASDFIYDLEWIARRLRVDVTETRKIILRLKRLNLVTEDSNHELKRTYTRLNTSEDVESAALKFHHQKDLETISKSLSKLSVKQRDFSSLTFLFKLEDIDKAKEILRRAQDEIEALSPGDPKRHVFKVSTYLYPVTDLES